MRLSLLIGTEEHFSADSESIEKRGKRGIDTTSTGRSSTTAWITDDPAWIALKWVRFGRDVGLSLNGSPSVPTLTVLRNGSIVMLLFWNPRSVRWVMSGWVSRKRARERVQCMDVVNFFKENVQSSKIHRGEWHLGKSRRRVTRADNRCKTLWKRW